MTTASTPKTTCPAWCAANHSQGDTAYHEQTFDFEGGSVEILEAIDDGTWLVPVPVGVLASLWVGGEEAAGGMSADVCRKAGAALLAAADKLDKIDAAVI